MGCDRLGDEELIFPPPEDGPHLELGTARCGPFLPTDHVAASRTSEHGVKVAFALATGGTGENPTAGQFSLKDDRMRSGKT